ncbi:MAG TPA: hypothetical protein P5121_04820, partial [Caldilineaceae bacterium]|nr:hypothetical protein [Caldilineaceae bacterium]
MDWKAKFVPTVMISGIIWLGTIAIAVRINPELLCGHVFCEPDQWSHNQSSEWMPPIAVKASSPVQVDRSVPATDVWLPIIVNGPALIPPVVHLAAVATDAEGHDIHYEWRVTDGALSKIDGDQTDWTLPPGPGLHIAYVLAGDGHGGYTEKRVIVSTDELKTPPALIGGPDIVAPPAADVPGSILRGLLRQRVYYEDPSDEFGLGTRAI